MIDWNFIKAQMVSATVHFHFSCKRKQNRASIFALASRCGSVWSVAGRVWGPCQAFIYLWYVTKVNCRTGKKRAAHELQVLIGITHDAAANGSGKKLFEPLFALAIRPCSLHVCIYPARAPDFSIFRCFHIPNVITYHQLSTLLH